MPKNNKCWEKAYKLYREGNEEAAILLCKTEPCANISIDCQRYLGWASYDDENKEEAIFWFNKGAEKNDPESYYGLACVYFNKNEFERALNCYKSSHKYGYKRASYWIGYMYENGLGTTKDYEIAIKFYREGAEKGYLISERQLIGIIFSQGSLFEKIFILPKFIILLLKGISVSYKDSNSEELADVPNKFDRLK